MKNKYRGKWKVVKAVGKKWFCVEDGYTYEEAVRRASLLYELNSEEQYEVEPMRKIKE